jgi:hypothetical protein
MTYLAPIPRVRPSGWMIRLSSIANVDRAPVPAEIRQPRALSEAEMAEIEHTRRECDAEQERAAAGERIAETLAAQAKPSRRDRMMDVVDRGIDWMLYLVLFMSGAGLVVVVASAVLVLAEVL